jgi:hypothetical protein
MRDADDKTALHYGAEHADPTVFHMLLQAGTGPDAEIRTFTGDLSAAIETPLSIA